jgi:predicted transcriptional regulator
MGDIRMLSEHDGYEFNLRKGEKPPSGSADQDIEELPSRVSYQRTSNWIKRKGQRHEAWCFGIERAKEGRQMNDDNSDNMDLTEMTAEIAAAYVSKNSVAQTDLAALIAGIHSSLGSLGAPKAPPAPAALVPAVPIKKSVTPDYIICLEDGKQFKALKGHLTRLGMTPKEYRSKWALPSDYPMVAATYAARRSELAQSMGLGRKKVEPVAGPARKASRGRKVSETAG